MNEASALPDIERPRFDGQALKASVLQDDRRFGVALALAILLHASFLVGFNSSGSQRRLGDPTGAAEAISVALISEADLRGRATVDDSAAGRPVPVAPPVQAAPQPSPPMPPPQPTSPAEAVPPPKEPALAEPALPGEGLKKAPEAVQKKTAKPVEQTKPEEAKEAPKEPAKEQRPAQKKTRTTRLDLTPPPATFTEPFSGSGGAGMERPPGITRSGENDAFARGVIRALQRTMPQLSNTQGRVTVQITLDKNGSLVSTQVVRPSSVGGLDQNVVFATRQSSFPLPPRNAIPVDLIFVVTYIYR